MQNNPSIGHMIMAVACILLLGVLGEAIGHVTWLDVYRMTGSAIGASVLSRMFAGFE